MAGTATMAMESSYSRYLHPEAVAITVSDDTTVSTTVTDDVVATHIVSEDGDDGNEEDSQMPLLKANNPSSDSDEAYGNNNNSNNSNDSDFAPGRSPTPHRLLQCRPLLKKRNSSNKSLTADADSNNNSRNRSKSRERTSLGNSGNDSSNSSDNDNSNNNNRSKSRERRKVPRSRSNQSLLERTANEYNHSERSGCRPGLMFKSFSFSDRNRAQSQRRQEQGSSSTSIDTSSHGGAKHVRPEPKMLAKKDSAPEPPVRRGVRRHQSCRGNLMVGNSSSERSASVKNKDKAPSAPGRRALGPRSHSSSNVLQLSSSQGRRNSTNSDANTGHKTHPRRGLSSSTSSHSDRQLGRRNSNDSAASTSHKTVPRRGVRRHNSCKDRLGSTNDEDADESRKDAGKAKPLTEEFLGKIYASSNTNNNDNTNNNGISTEDELEHLKAISKLYKEEFKRVVQEKKQLLGNFVSETAELTEEVAVLRRMLAQSKEENKKLRQSLNDVGVQPSSLAALTESDGLAKSTFEHHHAAGNAESESSRLLSPLENRCDVVKGPGWLVTQVHRPRPMLFALPGLRSLPFWTQTSSKNVETEVAYQDTSLTWAVRHFEKHYMAILGEYNRAALAMPSGEAPEHVMRSGACEMRSYLKRGKIQRHFTEKFPRTSAILQAVRDKGLLLEDVPFGAVYFSSLQRQSQVATHTSPMNLRIRLHLPLVVPEGLDSHQDDDHSVSSNVCGLRVGPLRRYYEAGKVVLMDDSYDHESWNESSQDRVILVVDLWHPDVTNQERKTIVAHSNSQGKQEPDDWSVMS